MSFPVEETTIHSYPHAFINKKGEPILVTTLSDRRCQRLVEMYLAYQPRNSFQGLPPIQDTACENWVKHMIAHGINLVAMAFGEGVVGHVALFPIDNLKAEILVVVSPPMQNTGIGTEMTRCCIQLAHELGFEEIWLSVSATNVTARHVYKKCGFAYGPAANGRELEMSLDLKRFRDAVAIPVSRIMTEDVIAVALDDPCEVALRLFLEQSVATLPVVDEGRRLRGIVSESDLLLPVNIDRKVSDIFTREVVTVSGDCTVAQVIRLFQGKKVRCIPVVDDEGRLAGVIGRKDILAYYATHD